MMRAGRPGACTCACFSPLFDAPQAWRTPQRSEGRDALRPDRFRIPLGAGCVKSGRRPGSEPRAAGEAREHGENPPFDAAERYGCPLRLCLVEQAPELGISVIGELAGSDRPLPGEEQQFDVLRQVADLDPG